MLWQRRLGHFHHTTLLLMKKNNLVKGLPDLEEKLPPYAACQYGKQTRLPFLQNKTWSIVIKPGPGVDPAKGPGARFHGSTRVNPD